MDNSYRVGYSRKLWHEVKRFAARWPVGARHVCCLCGGRVQRFLPYREGLAGMPAVVTMADIIGSDVENFECPACGCHDRERHLFLYFKAVGLLESMRGARVLHFAPESRLRHLIAAAGPAAYVRADLHPRQVGVQAMDLTAIDCPADNLDFVIANHVLEHVDDDAKALREIFRVLKPGGRAVLQTPFSALRPGAVEDPRIESARARLEAYGQEDHCRLYGRNFAEHVMSFGFISHVGTHGSLLPNVDAHISGVNAREPFLLFAKPEAGS